MFLLYDYNTVRICLFSFFDLWNFNNFLSLTWTQFAAPSTPSDKRKPHCVFLFTVDRTGLSSDHFCFLTVVNSNILLEPVPFCPSLQRGLSVRVSILLRLQLLLLRAVLLGGAHSLKEAQLRNRSTGGELTMTSWGDDVISHLAEPLTLYMMKMSSANSSRPARTARATTHPGTDWGGSATQTTDRLTCARVHTRTQTHTRVFAAIKQLVYTCVWVCVVRVCVC